jgi:hypothetical protein
MSAERRGESQRKTKAYADPAQTMHKEGENQPQQPRQPEQTQPLQGRAAGRESLQGPTTVEWSAHGGSESTRVQPGTPLASPRVRQIHNVEFAEGIERRAQELDAAWVRKMQARGEEIPRSPEEIREKRLESRRRWIEDNRKHVNEQQRRRRKERAEQGLFSPSKQPKQVFPEPTQE